MVNKVTDPGATVDTPLSRRVSFRGVAVNLGHFVLALLVLVACLFFGVADSSLSTSAGIAVDSRWRVIEVTICDEFLSICDKGTALQRGDQIFQVGDLTYEAFLKDKSRALFQGYGEGQPVPILFERDGEVMSTEWLIPRTPVPSKLGRILLPLLAYFPFWLAGTAILLFMQPHTRAWRYYVLLLFVTAFWLAVGFASNSRVVFSSPILHATTWLMVPVYLAMHLEAPKPIYQRMRRYLLPALTILAAILVLLELLQRIPFFAYFLGLVLVIGGSAYLLVSRLARDPSPEVSLTSRLMLIGLLAAYLPAFFLWLLPTAEGSGTPDALVVSLSIAPFPLLPLFYTYALYKQRLGKWETRLHRLLTYYVTLWLYLVVFSTAIFLGSRWLKTTNELIFLSLGLGLGAVLLGFFARDFRTHFWNRLAYGRTYSPRDIFSYFAGQIPAATHRNTMIRILSEEVAPALQIQQSALYLLGNGSGALLFRQNVDTPEALEPVTALDPLLLSACQYMPPAAASDGEFGWVRLAVPVLLHGQETGLWLFGRRHPDDYYTQGDITLLQDLANLVAVAVENGRLLQKVEEELYERERAEKALSGYAERLELMHEIDLAILAADSPAQIAQVAVERIHTIVSCIRASIKIFDSTSNELELLAAKGGDVQLLAPGQRPDLADFSEIFSPSTLRPRIIADVRQWGTDPKPIQALLDAGVEALIVVPLVATDRLVGTLNVGVECAEILTDEVVDIVTEVANSVSVALHNARLLEAVTRHSQDLKLLSAQLLEAQEQERQRISQELHDEMGQMLTAITFGLAAIEKTLPARSMAVRDELAEISALVEQLIRQVRDLAIELRPSMLRDLGLVPTLRWYIGNYARRTAAEVEFEVMGLEERAPSEVETTLYRIVQEGLTNAARHAQANHVRVQLTQLDGVIRLVIEDDGCGFEVDGTPAPIVPGSGVGLVGMRERVATLGGEFAIRSAPGEGVCIRIELPVGEKS